MKIKKNQSKGSFAGPAATPVEGIAEIDFGVPATAPGIKRISKYPLIEGEGVPELVDRIIDLNKKFDDVADPFKAAKLELVEIGFPQFFEKNALKREVPSSMVAYGTGAGGARVTFKDKFTPGIRAELESLLTAEVAGKHFHQHWIIKIDGDEIPPGVGAALISELKALMGKHGASHALEIKAAIIPNSDFSQKRHTAFDQKTNLAIQLIVPQQAAVSTKGVK